MTPTAGAADLPRAGGAAGRAAPAPIIKEVVLQVVVAAGDDRSTSTTSWPPTPRSGAGSAKILQADDPEDENAVVYLDTAAPDDPADAATCDRAIDLMVALQTPTAGRPRLDRRQRRRDARAPADLLGDDADPDDATQKATGLEALGEIDDIAIVALPDGGTYDDADTVPGGCRPADRRTPSGLRYRIAVVDAPQGSSHERGPRLPRQVRLQVRRPLPPVDRDPRSARSGRPRALRRAGSCCRRRASSPASTPATTSSAASTRRRPTRSCAASPGSRRTSTTPRNDVLNPEGINALRFFEGRGNRVWGARTMTLGPGVEVRQRPPALHLPRALDRQGDAVGGVRAEQRAALGQHPADGRGLPATCSGTTARCSAPSPRRPSSSAATAPP